MPPTFDLTTVPGLAAYLAAHHINHTSITPLAGGTANYVFRVRLPSGETRVYKHAAPHLRSNAAFALSVGRMDVEARVLGMLESMESEGVLEEGVRAVRKRTYDCEAKVLCLEDGGTRTVKSAYGDVNLDIEGVGRRLGRWIAGVHGGSKRVEFSLDGDGDEGDGDGKEKAKAKGKGKSKGGNNDIAVSVYRYPYVNLHAAYAAYTGNQADTAFATHINDAYGSLLATDDECLCHGDFWPGNVLVGPLPLSPSSLPSSTPNTTEQVPTTKKEDAEMPPLTIIDLELSRLGTSATDTAQFLAEAYLLDRFHGARGLAPAFLNAYLAARQSHCQSHSSSPSSSHPDADADSPPLNKEWWLRLAVHWGVHITFWPTRVRWTEWEGTRGLVAVGDAVLRAAVERNWEGLWGMDCFRGVEERFRPTG